MVLNTHQGFDQIFPKELSIWVHSTMITKTNPDSVLGSLNSRVAGSFFISPFLLGLGLQTEMALIILSRLGVDQILQMKHDLRQPT